MELSAYASGENGSLAGVYSKVLMGGGGVALRQGYNFLGLLAVDGPWQACSWRKRQHASTSGKVL